MEWIFSGIGTSVVIFFFGLLVGGTSGYSIAMHKNKTINKNTTKVNTGDGGVVTVIGGNKHE